MKMIVISILVAFMATGCVGEATPNMKRSSLRSDTLNNNEVEVFSFWNTKVVHNYGKALK